VAKRISPDHDDPSSSLADINGFGRVRDVHGSWLPHTLDRQFKFYGNNCFLGAMEAGMSRRDGRWRNHIGIIVVAALTSLLPIPGCAAPPPADTEYFNALYRKTLEEYDRVANTDSGAREAFQQGLGLLDKGEFNSARSRFAKAHADGASYAAAFNEALSAQLAHQYREADALYVKARRPDLPDPELETNDAIALAAEGKEDDSAKAFEAARASTSDPHVVGRILYQRALVQFRNAQLLDAFDSLRMADDALKMSDDVQGRAVVAAVRGTKLLDLNSDGEKILLDAIAQLQRAGALVDESDARTSLALYYSRVGELPKSEPHLVRAVAAARDAHHWQQIGRSLNVLGAYQYQTGQRDQAISSYQEAVAVSQMVRDRFGEGEATNNLAGVYLKSNDIERAFPYFDAAVRAYRRAGSSRAFVKALAFADVFRQLRQERRQKYFLDIARSLLGDPPNPGNKARFLVAQAYYDVGRDRDAAAIAAREARGIFSARQDADGVTIADLVLERVADARSAALTHLFLVVAACSGLLLAVIHFWTEIWDMIRGAAGVIAAPFRAAAAWYRRVDHAWTGRMLPDADEETRRADQYRSRVFRIIFFVTIIAALIFDAVTITVPNLAYVEKIRQIAASESQLLPPDVIDSLQGLLNRDENHILLAALVQIVVLALCYVAAVVITISIETFVFGLLQRPLRRVGPPIDAVTRAQAVAALESRQHKSAWISIAALAGAFVLSRYRVLSDESIGLLLLAVLFVTEAGLSALLYRALRGLTADKRKSAFAFVSRIGFYYIGTLFVGILAFVWAILPGFYQLSRIAQMRLVLPTFNDVADQFLPLLTEAVKKYGTVFLTGEVFVIFANLKEAYDPGKGASEFWTDLLPLLPLALWVWAVYLFWRLLVPFIATLGPAGVAWKAVRLTLSFLVLHEVLAPALVFLFHLDEDNHLVKLSVIGISLVLMLILEHTVMAAFGGHDQHPPQAAPPIR
jgi:tetratricopeptide (TPR) repeat protein